ncbi:hypothetical protein PR048_007884 [Dryococelus australis]|uniref:Uncharacterized protein n=1 Tax=Dryococelus australis TaxID=614101 RepID=A0ABQ9HVH9_9NEOP|nr:hypothetical protein PR048_007884 [Dryococelus australis]
MVSGKKTVCDDVRKSSAVSTVVGRGKCNGSEVLQADDGHAEDGMPDASISAEFYCSGKLTVGQIVRSTCETLWTHLQPIYMHIPDEGIWKDTANCYSELWNLPTFVQLLLSLLLRIYINPFFRMQPL